MSSLKLLVVEDSHELVRIWRTLFRVSTDFKVKFCLSGSCAKETISAGYKPDVVLTDYYLGDTNGIALMEEIREARPSSKFIVITGNTEDERMLKMHRQGLFALLHKPVKFDLIKQNIEAVARQGT
ncbi:response regulator [Pseudobacteriovorax antillogorgiicola]|uniref:Response regulator receiver domain-containing protein n=1 Tax=Pseudobacteriovorax antillogorgiicola TaxID=1513793 RepID=A0A1Y6BAY2_9BACT|nr:response regulator [Pseudobacteriovorax antillogorgiicola]TCS57462.1 response regulator receiver domain-containing protein [Pseudobacteriovorax antillogorgiicola]SMF00764.1 Response regulator receiver domain-containing protein [Pseudobacteriovorax antillogorgiicola]